MEEEIFVVYIAVFPNNKIYVDYEPEKVRNPMWVFVNNCGAFKNYNLHKEVLYCGINNIKIIFCSKHRGKLQAEDKANVLLGSLIIKGHDGYNEEFSYKGKQKEEYINSLIDVYGEESVKSGILSPKGVINGRL